MEFSISNNSVDTEKISALNEAFANAKAIIQGVT
jgi:hypothetical protein